MKYYAIALLVLKKMWPVALEVAKAASDGKITKEEAYVIAEEWLGEDDVIYLWGKPNV